MKRILGARFLIVFTILSAISGFLLRSAYNNNGNAAGQIVVSAIAVAVISAVSLFLTRETTFEAVFHTSVPDFVLSVLAGVLLAIGGIARFFNETGFSKAIGIFGFVAAAALLFSAVFRLEKKPPKSFGYIAVLLFFIIKLFFDFRRWMVDPAILDYCYLLFSSISFMLASFYAACFCYNRGKRSLLVISSLCGVFFGFASFPDLVVSEFLLYCGSVLWMMSCAWQALRDAD